MYIEGKMIKLGQEWQTKCPKSSSFATFVLQEHGFINYFGMQRFGTSEIPTHKVKIRERYIWTFSQ